jgi:hypothetical protein
MKRLHVSLAYRASDFGRPSDPDADVALPVKALDGDGTVLDEGSASSSQPAELEVPEETGMAYVRLTWPSGRTETQRADLSNTSNAWVTFSDAAISRNEWAAWAVPKLNRKTPLAHPEAPTDRGMDEFKNVWLRLWRFEDGAWKRERLRPIEERRNNVATQMDLDLGHAHWLLQVGGSNVTWRFVAVPGGGRARILITPKDSKDPRADELKVVVTSFRERAETLLEFLSRDAMRSVSALGESVSFARHMLSEKFQDPVAAVAGAYYLLRFNRWDTVPLGWFESLSANFSWIPDTAIVHCARLLRSGSDAPSNRLSPEALLQQALSRGWPVYAEGVSLLQEAASLLKSNSAVDSAHIRRIEALGSATAWAGAATSFYGRAPDAPDALRWVGRPQAPRRHRIIRELIKPRSLGQVSIGLAETSNVIRAHATDTCSPRPEGLPRQSADDRVVKGVALEEEDEFLIGNIARLSSLCSRKP